MDIPAQDLFGERKFPSSIVGVAQVAPQGEGPRDQSLMARDDKTTTRLAATFAKSQKHALYPFTTVAV